MLEPSIPTQIFYGHDYWLGNLEHYMCAVIKVEHGNIGAWTIKSVKLQNYGFTAN